MRKIVIAVLSSLLILAALLAVVLFADPFGWNLLGRFRGDYDTALTAVPPTSSAYIGADLLLLNSQLDDLEALGDAFATTEGAMFEEMRQEFEALLQADFGVSWHDDLLPWVGQYLGLAIVDVELDETGRLTRLGWLISAETRNAADSEAFLQKLGAGWAQRTGATAVSTAHNGVTITSFPGDDPIDQLAFTLDDDLVLIGADAAVIQAALDTRQADALAQNPVYQKTLDALPADRFLTAYIAGDQLSTLAGAIPGTVLGIAAADLLPPGAVGGTAVAFSVVPAGFQIDAVTAFDTAAMSAAQRTALRQNGASGDSAALFPADTLLHLPAQPFSNSWAALRQTLIDRLGERDFTESMDLFRDQFGLDLDGALLPALTGPTAVGLRPVAADPWFGSSGLGLVVAATAADGPALASRLSDFASTATGAGIGTITPTVSSGGLPLNSFETFLFPDFAVTYGQDAATLWLGSGTAVFDPIPVAAANLADQPAYQAAIAGLPVEMTPGFYVNMSGLLDVVEQGQGTLAGVDPAGLRPLTAIAAASDTEGTLLRHTVVFFIVTSGQR